MADDRNRRRPRVAGHRRVGGTPPPDQVESTEPRETPPEVTATEPAVPQPLTPELAAPEPTVAEPTVDEPTATEATIDTATETRATEPAPPATPTAPGLARSGAEAADNPAARPANPIAALRPAVPDRPPSSLTSPVPAPSDPSAADLSAAEAPEQPAAAPASTSLSSPPFDGEPWQDLAPSAAAEPAASEPAPARHAEANAAAEAVVTERPAEVDGQVPSAAVEAEPARESPNSAEASESDDAAAVAAAAGSGHRGRRRRRGERGDDVAPATTKPSAHAATAPPRRGRRLGWSLVAVLLVAVIALAVVDLVRFTRSRTDVAVNSSETRAAVSAAVNAAGPLTSYSYKTTTAAKVARAKPLVTAACAASYQKDLSVLSSTLNPLKSIETVDITSGGVSTTAKNQVVVLVFGERTSQDSRLTTPRVEGLQVSLTMVREQGRWLVSAVINAGSGGANATTC